MNYFAYHCNVMIEINLTKEIDNENGYIDDVVSQIKSVPTGEPLRMLITCEGGNVFQGDRLQRALLEHKGHTSAVVIGLAASMASKLLAAFDSVEIDAEAELMYHKAHIAGAKMSDLDDNQKGLINRFNARAYSRLKDSGVNEEFLNKVFLSDSDDDYWLTAKEAEALGIGKVAEVKRENYKPLRLAAKANINKIKMGLFDKKPKTAPRVVNTLDGKTIIFNSDVDGLRVSDIVNIVGESEPVTGKFKLTNNVTAEIEKDKVVAMEEGEDQEEFNQAEQINERLTALENALAEMLKKMNGVEDVKEEVTNLLNSAKEITSGFVLPKMDDKKEPVMKVKDLSSDERAYQMRLATLNNIK